jgi:hypothetical protein
MKSSIFHLAIVAAVCALPSTSFALEALSTLAHPVILPSAALPVGLACNLYPLSVSVTCGVPSEGPTMGYLSLVGTAGETLSAPLQQGYPQSRRLYRLNGTLTAQYPGSTAPQTFEVEGSYSEQDSMGQGWFFGAAGLNLYGQSFTISGGEFEGASITWDGQQWRHPCSVTFL